MLTRQQWFVFALWVGGPFVVLVVLLLINPAYASGIFEPLGPVAGMSLVVTLQAFNALALYAGFGWLNRRAARRATPEQPHAANRAASIVLAVLTLLLFTLPALWLVVLYPSLVRLLRTPDF
jgi:hypothetical protein